MPRQAERLIPPFRTIVLAAVTAFLMTPAALPMSGQSSVPPTAAQAGRMPEFASRLAHGAGGPASRPHSGLARRGAHNGPPDGGIYNNGPINGTTDAWTINFGYVVSDTITVSAATGTSGMTFGAWLFPGDTLISAELSITSQPNGGISYFDQTVSLSQAGCTTNQFGFVVCTVTALFNGPSLQPGTYWVNLENASVPSGNPVYWDENSGVGCSSPGCPSQAYDNSVGTIPSEAFTMFGSNPPPPGCFEPQGDLQVIFDFTSAQGYNNNGVTIDSAGNLYGTSIDTGDYGAGFAYKLSHHGGWLLDPLFSFFGGYNGGNPSGVIVGPNGSLYGGALGGIQNCGPQGNQGCGLVFNLTPQPIACRTALCGWNESVPYRFTSESDGFAGFGLDVTASDQQGNLYGTTYYGGAYDAGIVFELTPSGGGWTKTTLYSFTGSADGSAPTQVLVGNDGNLYGVAGGGLYGNGVVFRLKFSGGQWIESVLVAFDHREGSPSYLVQDNAGNLYGLSSAIGAPAALFALEKTGSGWVFSEYDVPYHNDCVTEVLSNLAIDAAGNLYGTGYTFTTDQECASGYVFKAWYGSDGWHYEDRAHFRNQFFLSSGSLTLDTGGNLYGTTDFCGANGAGTVWQVSP